MIRDSSQIILPLLHVCRVCRRPLTDAESVRRGIGARCLSKALDLVDAYVDVSAPDEVRRAWETLKAKKAA